jgi:hypothetical protein
MVVLSLVLQSLLTLYSLFSGVAKIIGAKYWVDMFQHLKLPQWFRVTTGLVQLVGVVLLIIGYWFEGTIAWAGIWLGITMLLACLAHVKVKDPIGKIAPAIGFAVINVVLISLNTYHLLHPFS